MAVFIALLLLHPRASMRPTPTTPSSGNQGRGPRVPAASAEHHRSPQKQQKQQQAAAPERRPPAFGLFGLNPNGMGYAGQPGGVQAAAAGQATVASVAEAQGAGEVQQHQLQQPLNLEDEELLAYVTEGPLLTSCGFSPEAVYGDAAEWLRLGRRLAVQLEFDHDALDAVQKWVAAS